MQILTGTYRVNHRELSIRAESEDQVAVSVDGAVPWLIDLEDEPARKQAGWALAGALYGFQAASAKTFRATGVRLVPCCTGSELADLDRLLTSYFARR